MDAIISAAKDRVSYNDDDTTAFGLVKLGIGGYAGSIVGITTGNPLLGMQVASDITKYLNENPFTISLGVQGNLAAGANVTVTKQITLDAKGNLVIQHSDNVGGGSPGYACLYVRGKLLSRVKRKRKVCSGVRFLSEELIQALQPDEQAE